MTLSARESEAERFLEALRSLLHRAEEQGYRSRNKLRQLKNEIIRLLGGSTRKRLLLGCEGSHEDSFIYKLSPEVTLPDLEWLVLEGEDVDGLRQASSFESFMEVMTEVVREQMGVGEQHIHGYDSVGDGQPAVKAQPPLVLKRNREDETIAGDAKRQRSKSPFGEEILVTTGPPLTPIEITKPSFKDRVSEEVTADATAPVNEDLQLECSLPEPQVENQVEIGAAAQAEQEPGDRENAPSNAIEQRKSPFKQNNHGTTIESDIILEADGKTSPAVAEGPGAAGLTVEEQLCSLSDAKENDPGEGAASVREPCTNDTKTRAVDEDGGGNKESVHIALKTKTILKLRQSVLMANLSQIEKTVGEIRYHTPTTWDSHKAQMVRDLLALDGEGMAATSGDTAQDLMSRVEAAMDTLSDHVAKIPAPRLAIYREKLRKSCSSTQLLGQNPRARLYHIIDIIYLPEELEAVATLDWDRLEQAAVMCAFVCEMTGPLEEQAKGWLEVWLRGRMREIAWLRKFFAAQEAYLRPASVTEEKEV